MIRICSALLLALCTFLAATPAAAQQKDAANCKDHPLLSRLPDYWIESCVQKQFDAYKFAVGKGQSQVEGQFWNIRYQPPRGLATKPSTLQVLRNVENAVKKVGGTVVAGDSSKAFGNGPYAPVASNDAEAGRANNRRVELVKD